MLSALLWVTCICFSCKPCGVFSSVCLVTCGGRSLSPALCLLKDRLLPFCYWLTVDWLWSLVVLAQTESTFSSLRELDSWFTFRAGVIRICLFMLISLCKTSTSCKLKSNADSTHSELHCTSEGLPVLTAWRHKQCLWVACQTLDLLYQAGNLTRQLFSCLLAPLLVMDFLNERLSFSRFHTSACSAGPPSRSHASPLTLISQGKWSIGPKCGQRRHVSGLRSLILYTLM